MTQNRSPLFAVLMMILSTSCVSQKQLLCRTWIYTFKINSSDKVQSYQGEDSVLTPANFLNLKKDGSFTIDFGSFEYGSWDEKNDTVFLKDHQGKTTPFFISSVSLNQMRISMNEAAYSFEGIPDKFSKSDNDPFSKENNLWRIPATHKESDEEIKQRLKNHFKFWEKYFGWALNNEIETVDVRATPSLIKIYGNGFTLRSQEDLSPKWVSYFYDENDCMKASAKMQMLIENTNIAWPPLENKYQFFISGFQQVQQMLK
jgi:hypothetical protein